MNKFIIPLLVLFTSSFVIAGEIQVNNSKNITYTKQHTEHWDKKPWARSVSDNSYRKFQTEAMKARYEGYLSKQTVSATVEAQVSRKTVLSGAFNLVKRGAALGTRLSGWGTAAYFAYEAYQAVKSPIESAGYKYDEKSEEFLKYWDNKLCIWDRRGDYPNEIYKEYECSGVDSSIIRAYKLGGKSRSEAEFLMKSKMEAMANNYWPDRRQYLVDRGNSEYLKYNVSECIFSLNGGSCSVSNGSDSRSSISFKLIESTFPTVLDSQEFLKIATPSIDGNPTPFVEGTGKPEYNEKVSVPAGTVVTIGPVTPENGKPVQITITFGKDSNGNTTAEVATTQRPDLTPGGSEAPKTKPDPDPAPNPDGKPDKKPDDKPDPDGNPDKRPDDKPDDDPSDKRKEDKKEDKKDDKKEESKGLLCNVFPDILACSEKGDVEEQEEPFKIPHTNNETTFSPDFFLPDNGVCPAPRTATYLGITMEFKYDMICNFAEMIRFLVIGIAAVAAAFIMFSSRKD